MSGPANLDEQQPLLHSTAKTAMEESKKTKEAYAYDNDGFGRSPDDTIIDECDYDKQATKKTMNSKKLLVVMSILVTELCERLTYYSVVANLVLFCTSVLHYTSNDATTVSLVFSGTVYLIPVVGGYVADSMAGRFNTILGAGLIYTLGLFLLPAASLDYTTWFGKDEDGASFDLSVEARRGYFIMGLVLVAIGTGGIKANVGPFGAQQVQEFGEDAVQSFFNWFYWFINAGALIAYSAVAYVQQNISFAWGFLVPLISMLIALFVFFLSRRYYEHQPPTGSILTTVFKVCSESCTGRKHHRPFFSSARQQYGGSFNDYTVNGIICVLRVLPIFLLIIIYWAIYSQMQSTFFLQGERMSVQVGDGKVPAAMLNIFNTIIILLLIPFVDRVLYPFFQKIGHPLTHLQRMGIGMILAAGSVIVAGVVEIYRKKELSSSGGVVQELGGEKFNSSHLTIFIQAPEFALVGASEVFASISGLEFSFTQAPPSMQGLLTGLFFAASGLGNYVSTAILRIVEAATKSDPWFPDEINKGHAEYLFFLMGGLMMTNFFIFIFVSACYKYREPEPEPELESDKKGILETGKDSVSTKL